MFMSDWLILRILHQSFEIERSKGHWSEVVVHLYNIFYNAQRANVCMCCMVCASERYSILKFVTNRQVVTISLIKLHEPKKVN